MIFGESFSPLFWGDAISLLFGEPLLPSSLEAILVIDIVVGLLTLAGLVYGFRYGLVGAMAHLAAIPVGLAFVIRLSPITSGWFQQWLPRIPAAIIGWVLTSMLIGLGVALLLRLANTILKRTGLKTTNHLLGGWCGLVGMVIVLALLYLMVGVFASQGWSDYTDRHVSLRCLRAVAQEIEGRMPAHMLPQIR
ncbi:MAG: CvpA family protein [Candidatus Cloacimonetes bacterium]|nr:CvpA family protein [Candidatus Cloacimonadota bacterium]